MKPDTHALAGAYAVNALNDEERISFERHLGLCGDCLTEVAQLSAAASMLATNVERLPPLALRTSVLSGISQTRQLPASAGPGFAADPEFAAMDQTSPDAPVTDELAARRQRRLRPWLAAAVAAAVVTIGGLSWQPWENAAPTLTATEQVLRSSDAQRLEQPMGASEIAIVRSASRKQAVFVADAMPPAPSGKAFQLWLDLPGQGMVSAGLIPTAGSTVAVLLDGDASAASGAGITLEPQGGSEKPTTTPVALFAFV